MIYLLLSERSSSSPVFRGGARRAEGLLGIKIRYGKRSFQYTRHKIVLEVKNRYKRKYNYRDYFQLKEQSNLKQMTGYIHHRSVRNCSHSCALP